MRTLSSLLILFLALPCLESALQNGFCIGSVCGKNGHCQVGPLNGTRRTFWCRCNEGFYGSSCENQCQLSCRPNEKCVFNDETQKPSCVCKDCDTNGNILLKPACSVGYGGDKCQNQGWCYAEKCQNGGRCTGNGQRAKCECPKGFKGVQCEQDVNECEENKAACRPGTTCVNTNGSYKCVDASSDPCSKNPCIHGTCSSFSGGFQCLCDDGFSGSYCENGTNHCIGNKCAHGSNCINDANSYFCDCPPGKTGPFCEKMDCSAIPGICNHGSCIDNPQSEKAFDCQCDSGWEGDLCDVDKNECLYSNSICTNNGTCVNLPGSFRCDCARGFGGKWCQEPLDVCQDITCQNKGTCIRTSDNTPVCQCNPGFIGKRCEKECPAGFGGVRCDLKLSTGICSRTSGKCFNGGKCLQGFCVCPPDFTGNQCEVTRKEVTSSENLCQSDPCMNNATCIDVDAHIGYACICPFGYEGDICERRKDLCLENPCANGGICQQDREIFTCDCPSGFYGERCELEKRFSCTSNSCKNGGDCLRDGKSSKCNCSYGYTGIQCEEKINLDREKKDSIIISLCKERKCSERANDGSCDADCNFAVCKFDGGDCSGKRMPFAKCKYGNWCADHFADGQCNQACNNEDCLYDGMDCMPAIVRCPAKIREYCAARYANGICDPECNIDGCGFDGGDCANKTESTIHNDIRITVQMSPSEFQAKGGNALMEISSALRATVRIQRDEEGPLVFEWDGKNEQERVKMDVKKLAEQHVLSPVVRKIRSVGNDQVVVYLEVEENCAHGKCLYKDSQTVLDVISARLAKKGIDSFGVPISEALMARPRKSGGQSTGLLKGLLFVFCGGGGCMLIAFTGTKAVKENRSRKRRIINAPAWCPPMEHEDKNKRNNNNNNISIHSSQHSLLEPPFYEAKRHRGDFELTNTHMDGNGMVPYNQFFPQTYHNGNGYTPDFGGSGTDTGRTNSTRVSNDNRLSLLHEQAAGSGPITEPITTESVRIKDPNSKRNVLHWLAANSYGKDENELVLEVKRCIMAGADVNAMDSDENTPVMLAVKARRLKMAIHLMKAGADPSIYNKQERSALHEAAANRDHQMMKDLLTDQRLVREIDELERNGMTALMLLASTQGEGQITMAKMLIEKGAKIDSDGASRKDSEIYSGRTALHYAALSGNLPMVEFLVNQNANKDKLDEKGMTPIMLAAKEGHESVVTILINSGANIDFVDSLDRNARTLALQNFHHHVVEIFDNSLPLRLQLNTDLAYHHQQTQAAKKATRTYKSVKKQKANKKESPLPPSVATTSRDSTHLTPPPSDGSTSSPSPQHFMVHSTHTTPTSLQYMSPEYQPGSSDAFQPQCNTLPNGQMWYTASPMHNEPMMRHHHHHHADAPYQYPY